MENSLKPRIAVYTHDTFGLGHVKRCMHIIRRLAKDLPEAAILLVTGSPALGFFKDLPQNVDVMKIPTVVRTGASGSQPPHLPIGTPEIAHLRRNIIRETILSFSPDIFLVDNFPLGSQTELLPLLHELRNTPTKTIVGLRDIVNDPHIIRNEWKRQNIYDVLDRYYDKIFIYGNESIFDAVKEYALPDRIAKKVSYCGYLTSIDEITTTADEIRKELGIEEGPFILATGGGGGDAFPLLSTFLESQPKLPECTSVIFAGPLMGDEDRNNLRKQIGGNKKIIFKDYVSDLRPYLKACDVAVSMCGYNMASEIVFHGVRAVVSPRTWRFGEHANRGSVKKDKEQIMRAKSLAKGGYLDLIEPEKLTSDLLVEKVSHALTHPNVKKDQSININGLLTAVELIKEMV